MSYSGRFLFVAVFVLIGVFGKQATAQFVQQQKLAGVGAVGPQPAFQGSSVALSSDGNTAIVGGPGDNTGAGASWVFTRSGGVWSQQGPKLVGTDTTGLELWGQGASVSLSSDGNTAIVGGGDQSFVGGAYVFTRSGGAWSQEARLVGTGYVGQPWQGCSVSLSSDGNTAIVGGYGDNNGVGALWVFTRSRGIWSQQAKLVGSGFVGEQPAQAFSASLSSDGNTAIVGGPEDNNAVGAAWVFTRSGVVWSQQAKLAGTGFADFPFQGHSVVISGDGNTAIVGGYEDDYGSVLGGQVGAAWVFMRNGGAWSQQGPKLVGTGASDHGVKSFANQGTSVSLSSDGNTAIVGGPADSGGVGAVWVFTRNGGVWSQQGKKLVGKGASGFSGQGTSVSLSSDGTTALVGGPGDHSDEGAVWVFVRNGTAVGEPTVDIPQQFSLGQNYPNPFNPSTTVSYDLPRAAAVSLKIFNALGQLVATLVNERKEAGHYQSTWYASDVPSGIYFYRLQARHISGGQAGEYVETKKMILIR